MNVFKLIPALLILSILACTKNNNPNGNPTITSTSPDNQITGVARNKAISFTFSQAMDSSTINDSTFIVTQGSVQVPGNVTYSGNTATFTPSVIFTAGTAYTATINTGAKDLSGKSLQNNSVLHFTTGGSVTTLAVVNLGTAGNFVIVAKSAITIVLLRLSREIWA